MQAQSIGDDTIQFNYYIFNIQDGVTINHADGSSEISNEDMTQQENATSSENNTTTANFKAVKQREKQKEYVDQQGNGLIKGSRSGSSFGQDLNTMMIRRIRKNGSNDR